MATRILINGKEVTNPFLKTILILGAIVLTALVTSVIIFILLPIIGVAVTLSVGFVIIFIVASVISVVALGLAVVLFAWLFGIAEFRFENTHKRLI
jgi:cation transporter-like permease